MSNNGTQWLREELTKYRAARERVLTLRMAAAELPKAEEEFRHIERSILTCLDNNDLLQRGNMGWEGRILHFLADLTK